MLRDRLVSATLLITVALTLIWLDYRYPLLQTTGLWLLPLLLAFTVGTAIDVTRLLVASGRPVDRPIVIGTTAMVGISAYFPILWTLTGSEYPLDCPIGRKGWVAIAAVAAIFAILGREIFRYDSTKRGEALERTLGGIFVSCYVGIPMATLVFIRELGDSGWGLAAMITTIAVTKSADSGAYFGGKLFGKRKLIPHLSPGKTWEGAIGGIVASIGVCYVCFFKLIPAMSLPTAAASVWGPIVFGTLCAVTGMVGDLAESLVKRETGAKDSGRTLPGLGGVWDVTDSLLAAVVPAWVALAAGIAGM